jgi:SAM-dependent methyltransferase
MGPAASAPGRARSGLACSLTRSLRRRKQVRCSRWPRAYNRRVEQYVIRGGEGGYERLALLARTRWPDTAALFARAGLSPGMRCIDLGCGGGQVTLEIARLVAPGGSAVGVDMDEIKLDLARRAAAERGLVNVEFRQLNMRDWDEPDSYDTVYCRFLLQHLSEPVALLGRMWAAVRPRGVLIVEEADFDGWCCHPANEGFDFFVRTYSDVLKRRGGDPALGRKLYGGFLAAGIPGPEVGLVQPVWTGGEGKALAWSTLEASADAIVTEGVASQDDVTAALMTLQQFTADPQTLISGPRIFQLWSPRVTARRSS